MSIDPTRDPHARIVVKPLPSQVAAARAKAAEGAEAGGLVGSAGAGDPVGRPALAGAGLGARSAPDDPFLRAENEDDDGYDPYSDRPAPPEPLFSEDPWA